MTRKIYIEIGIGNPSFINTEIEKEDGSEYRLRGIVPFRILRGVYIRLWAGKTVYALSTDRGFNAKPKNRRAFKLLFGIYGAR